METLGIIFLVVAGLSFILCFLSTFDNDADSVFDFTSVLGTATGIMGAIIVAKADIPTEKDVLNGKAEYQEILHITKTDTNKTDTIKTYKIVWKPAGR